MSETSDGKRRRLERFSFAAVSDWLKVVSFIAVWGAAAIVALSFVTESSVQDPRIWMRPTYALKFGYTVSLVLLYIPLAAIVVWYFHARRSDADGSLKELIKGVISSTAVATMVFVIFDILFANLLFRFPDTHAVLGWNIPGYTWEGSCGLHFRPYLPSCYSPSIPIEEVLFYFGGAAVLRGSYIWASEDFLSLYTMKPDVYRNGAKAITRLLAWNTGLIIIVVLVIAGGFYLKYHTGAPGTLPTYLLLQVVIIFLPGVFLYTNVKRFINTRAFVMVMVLQVLVSVLWEVTMAVPYGWWAYVDDGMTGVKVEPWSDMPVEACVFWITVGWSAMFLHEATKLKVRSGRTWWGILTGRDRALRVHSEPIGI